MAAGLLVSTILAADDTENWEVIREKDGITVSRFAVEGRGFPILRAVGDVAGTPYEVLAILRDVQAHVHWRPDCVEARTISDIDAAHSIVYTRTNAPWPVSDRDVVLANEITFIDPPHQVRIDFSAVSDTDVPPRQGMVRMPRLQGYYLLESIDGNRSRVTYRLDVDPGGKLPDWLIRKQSVRNPFETIAGLRKRLEQTRGQYEAVIEGFPAAGTQ